MLANSLRGPLISNSEVQSQRPPQKTDKQTRKHSHKYRLLSPYTKFFPPLFLSRFSVSSSFSPSMNASHRLHAYVVESPI